jgi:hypothetical protein
MLWFAFAFVLGAVCGAAALALISLAICVGWASFDVTPSAKASQPR